MAVELVNGHVLIPHPADWSARPHWQRRWLDEAVADTRGGEDRACLRARPLVELTWLVTPIDQREWSMLEDRIRAALKSGLAAAPFHGRGIALAAAASGTSVELVAADWPFQAGDLIFLQQRDPWAWDSYEVAEIDSVSGIDLTLTLALSGAYAAGQFCWPLIFGQLSVSDFSALHNRRGAVQLSLLQIEPFAEPPSLLPWDYSACEVEITAGGGDSFDCYPIGELPAALAQEGFQPVSLTGGSGFDGGWRYGDADLNYFGDSFDTYQIGEAGTLDQGTGFDGVWRYASISEADEWARRVVDNGGAEPSSATVTAIQTFIDALKAANIYNKMVAINVFAPDSLIAARTPLIANAGLGLWTNNNFVAGDLTVDGLQGDGLTKYLDTGFNPTTGYANKTSASAFLMMFSGTTLAMGCRGSGLSFLVTQAGWDCWNETNFAVFPATGERILHLQGTPGFYVGSRIAANDSRAYSGTSSTSMSQLGPTVTNGASNRPNLSSFCFVRNTAGTPDAFSNGRCSFAGFGLGLSLAESESLKTASVNLRNSLGGGAP